MQGFYNLAKRCILQLGNSNLANQIDVVQGKGKMKNRALLHVL